MDISDWLISLALSHPWIAGPVFIAYLAFARARGWRSDYERWLGDSSDDA